MSEAFLIASLFEAALLASLVALICHEIELIRNLEARLRWWDECFQAKKWVFQGERLEVEVRLRKDRPEGAEGVQKAEQA